MSATESCSWCGADVELDDGFRAYEPAGERRAVFCRLEHLVPWSMQGGPWEPGALTEDPAIDAEVSGCSLCEAELGDVHVLLVRHRGGFRIPDGFCSVDHMAQWAKEGGRWR